MDFNFVQRSSRRTQKRMIMFERTADETFKSLPACRISHRPIGVTLYKQGREIGKTHTQQMKAERLERHRQIYTERGQRNMWR